MQNQPHKSTKKSSYKEHSFFLKLDEYIFKYKYLIILSLSIILLDRITKYLITLKFFYGEVVPVIDNFFNIVYVKNRGAGFSLFSQSTGFIHLFFIKIFPIILILGLIWYFFKFFKKFYTIERVSFVMIITGALLNLYDRLVYGYVVDFLDFYIDKYHWPAFNIADSSITIGAMLLIFVNLFYKKNKSNNGRTY